MVAVKGLDLPDSEQGFVASAASPIDLSTTSFIPMNLEGLERAGLRGVARAPTVEVVVVETDLVVTSSRGNVAPGGTIGLGATDRVLDGRDGMVWVSWQFGDAEYRLSLADGRLALETAVAMPELEVPAPDIEKALAHWNSWKPQSWLDALVRAQAAGNGLARAGALATLARFCEVQLETLLEGSSPWHDAVETWLSLEPRLRASVLDAAIAEASMLERELAEIQEAVAAREATAKELVRAWVHRRDDLESIVLVADKAKDQVVSLYGALDVLDEAAGRKTAVFADDLGVADERLRSVFINDPTRWWGELS